MKKILRKAAAVMVAVLLAGCNGIDIAEENAEQAESFEKNISDGRFVMTLKDCDEADIPSIRLSILNSATMVDLDLSKSNLVTIPANAFSGCTKLKSIVLPENLKDIKANAFSGCTYLEKVTIETINNIEEGIFDGCISLGTIELPLHIGGKYNGYKPLSRIISFLPRSVNIIITGNKPGFYTYTGVSANDLNKSGFPVSLDLRRLGNLNTVGIKDFENCKNLLSISLPDSVTSIGKRAFYGCSNLNVINLSNNLTNIGDEAFAECSSLLTMVIPSSVTKIGEKAFNGCSLLNRIKILGNLSEIGENAFGNCRVFEIPFSVVKTQMPALPAYSTVVVTGELTNSDVYAINYAISRSGRKLVADLSKVTGLTTIPTDAFENNTCISGIILPKTVTAIEGYAFSGCSSLKTVSLPESLNSIGSYVFESCTSLEEIKIPYSVTSIGNNAFVGCSSLRKIFLPDDESWYMTENYSEWKYRNGGSKEPHGFSCDEETAARFTQYPEYYWYKLSRERRALAMANVDNRAIYEIDIISLEKMFNSWTFDGEKLVHVEKIKNNTLSQIEQKIKTVFADTDDDDVSYIAISCHGNKNETNLRGSICIGTDGDLTGKSFRQMLDKYVKGEVVVFLDCCFAGKIIDRSASNSNDGIDTEVAINQFISDFYGLSARNAELVDKRFHVLCATDKNNYSYGGGDDKIAVGINAWEKGLGWDALGDKQCPLYADTNGDKKVTLAELHAYSAPLTSYCQHQVVYPDNDQLVIGGRY